MLRTLSTKSFRGLGNFTMSELGRVNLLVGMNNCGKTSVLEAVDLLLAVNPWAFWTTLLRRSEDIRGTRENRLDEMDVSHLFEGHVIDNGAIFSVTGTSDNGDDRGDKRLVASIVAAQSAPRRRNPDAKRPFSAEELHLDAQGGLALKATWGERSVTMPLTRAGGLSIDAVDEGPRFRREPRERRSAVEFITTGALNEEATVSRLEDVVLTENEDFLIRALGCIDSNIERIAPVGSRLHTPYRTSGGRGGVVVKLKDMANRIPLGSMGDGMWRVLGIALSLVMARNGVVLIDEIDTGLHYTVMESMWRLVNEAAERFNVQVFATTHSGDCYRALAAIVSTETAPPNVTIQRIERGKPVAVAFSDAEIAMAAKTHVEVR